MDMAYAILPDITHWKKEKCQNHYTAYFKHIKTGRQINT